jgi:DUF1365 family protein
MSSALYRGSLVHTRRDHLHRTFRYPVFMAAIDLDELPRLDRDLRLFSVDRRNLFSLFATDYSTSLASSHRFPRPSAAGRCTPNDKAARDSTTLVTNLRFAGYTFNPVSFFLRYVDDQLVGVTAEVNNTYGGRHCYTLDASNRIDGTRNAAAARIDAAERTASDSAQRTASDSAQNAADPRRIGFRTTRELFVSPFLHGPRVYEWWFPATRDPAQLAITMHVDTPDGDRIFTATLAGARHALTDRALVGAALRYPINTAQVIGLIHFEAMKLRYLHGQPYRRPGPDHRPLDIA